MKFPHSNKDNKKPLASAKTQQAAENRQALFACWLSKHPATAPAQQEAVLQKTTTQQRRGMREFCSQGGNLPASMQFQRPSRRACLHNKEELTLPNPPSIFFKNQSRCLPQCSLESDCLLGCAAPTTPYQRCRESPLIRAPFLPVAQS